MKIFKYAFLFTLLFTVAVAITSCKKMEGKDVLAPITGIGSVPLGAANTFIYQIKGGSVVTCKPTTYQLSFLQGTDPDTNAPVTLISAYNPTTQDLFAFEFAGLTTGNYELLGGYSIGGTSKGNTKGSAKVNVITYSVIGSGLQVTGTLQGTFDGYFSDQSGANTVRVAGSFNITQ